MEYVKGNNLIIISVGLVFLYLAYKSSNGNTIKAPVTTQPTSILKEKEAKKSPQKKEETTSKKKEEEPALKKKEKEESKKSPKKDDIPYLAKKSSD